VFGVVVKVSWLCRPQESSLQARLVRLAQVPVKICRAVS